MRHNQALQNNHFRKAHWETKVHTWFKQPFRAVRRHQVRVTKARQSFPNPIKMLRPSVHCMGQKYNYKLRLGKGFTLAELRAAHIDARLAPTIGIAVDRKRRNLSQESVNRNKSRLESYMARLTVLPMHKSAKAMRAQKDIKEAESRKKKAEAIKKFLDDHNKKVRDLKAKVITLKKEYLANKTIEKGKELKACSKAWIAAQKEFKKNVKKDHKKYMELANRVFRLPVKAVECTKRVMDPNAVIPLEKKQKLETAKLTKGMQQNNAVAILKRQKNIAKAVSGIAKGAKKVAATKKN
ncbi:60S ribosomal protein L13-1, putative [Entamoeba invadens IP1]|uniref:60S ribosomal protein L13-1, putative n=2 Tax=Entamoeba invadens TaxID=33085 RepID=A0A0A1U3T3_ENTIV|nr:60S ribosomal protein L13-1, putative [Entamoeba invadens IP1]ELP88884.1 60S ribosomal protein L13-1, putative [Entamoeba invadens IP1]BAN41827.1 60S ribosomal protein L13-1, putative [Entamoeba invadens]|eukprot:XP_004255655.1 60S ribosomal protein L13-1, putative [Entamoeba invadens IP1]